ncbi:preprotein translocase subunit SecE [Thioflexithrix psekupsensis]|uniref:Protein translocase subunit SecE n=1 Tax=Thioflexithrix psekupsensis TaxID=1570016 RepID=A0A251X3R2_9GAMM|nr:preprotein translocase subunit SecE [Thioflexithrix psekupsensis]OUD11995.1 preprotein translocase subunit SecE [Thioflexithrix psekupsensis]
MNTKMDAPSSERQQQDIPKWIAVAALIAVGVVSFYYFAEHSLLLRVVFLLSVIGVSVFIALKTEKGRNVRDFLHETHLEVRKVVWPSRQETLQTTGIVLLMVFVVAIFVWLLDSLLLWLVRLITG